MTPQTLGTIGIYLSAVFATAVFVAFVSLARFWRSKGGWHVFSSMAMIAWILDLTAAAHFADPPWFTWTRVATFTIGFPLVLAWQLWIVLDLQLLRRERGRKAYLEADSHPAAAEEAV